MRAYKSPDEAQKMLKFFLKSANELRL